MKPTLQQVLQWVLERRNNPSDESMHEHIAQRAFAAGMEEAAKIANEQSSRSVKAMQESKGVKARSVYSAAAQTADWIEASIRKEIEND